jgi:hypothetical protein
MATECSIRLDSLKRHGHLILRQNCGYEITLRSRRRKRFFSLVANPKIEDFI